MFNSKLRGGCAAVILFGVVSWMLADVGGKAHLAGSNCNNCHLSGKEVTPAQAHKLVASQEVLCGTCHPDARKVSHPSGFAPNKQPPAEYPLDWKHDLTCSSCHEVHGSKHGLLRGERRGKEFCLACHESVFFKNMKDAGLSIQQSGHLAAGQKLGDKFELDRYSLQCMGCHESQYDATRVDVGRNGILRHRSGAANHPIGRLYPTSTDAITSSELRPKYLLSKEIWLPDGKISCVSCHQGYNKEHGKIVVTSRRATLCLECHKL